MDVLIVSCVFPPEPVVSAQTSAHIAEELVQRRHRATVITSFPSRPSGKLFPGYTRQLFQRAKLESGVELIRCFSFLSSQSRNPSRFLENLSFGITSGWAVLTKKSPDVIYVNTWPIFAAGLISLIARIRSVPLVISVQDVYPESLVVQRRLKAHSFLVRWLLNVDRWIARQAKSVIVISESFAKSYYQERAINPDKLYVIPNWIDPPSVPIVSNNRFRESQNIPSDAFVVGYGGNIGMAAGTETLVEAFNKLRDLENVYLLIAGAGSNLTICQELARKMNLQRIKFYTPWPQAETFTVLVAADLLVLTTRGQQSTVSVPSKLLSYMMAGRPIIAQAVPGSQTACLIEHSQCGWLIEPNRSDLLAEKIRQVVSMEAHKRTNYGDAGRAFVLQNLTRQVCLPKVMRIIEGIGLRV